MLVSMGSDGTLTGVARRAGGGADVSAGTAAAGPNFDECNMFSSASLRLGSLFRFDILHVQPCYSGASLQNTCQPAAHLLARSTSAAATCNGATTNGTVPALLRRAGGRAGGSIDRMNAPKFRYVGRLVDAVVGAPE